MHDQTQSSRILFLGLYGIYDFVVNIAQLDVFYIYLI